MRIITKNNNTKTNKIYETNIRSKCFRELLKNSNEKPKQRFWRNSFEFFRIHKT